MKAAELARLGPRKQQNPAASVKAKGMEPTSPAWFNYFLMRICSFRKFTPDNGCPEPFDTGGHAWLGPAAPIPGWGSWCEGAINPQDRENRAN